MRAGVTLVKRWISDLKADGSPHILFGPCKLSLASLQLMKSSQTKVSVLHVASSSSAASAPTGPKAQRDAQEGNWKGCKGHHNKGYPVLHACLMHTADAENQVGSEISIETTVYDVKNHYSSFATQIKSDMLNKDYANDMIVQPRTTNKDTAITVLYMRVSLLIEFKCDLKGYIYACQLQLFKHIRRLHEG